jgi:hypothetical protein
MKNIGNKDVLQQNPHWGRPCLGNVMFGSGNEAYKSSLSRAYRSWSEATMFGSGNEAYKSSLSRAYRSWSEATMFGSGNEAYKSSLSRAYKSWSEAAKKP